ncbi:DUF1524 domain-containing protein [Agromyces sp. NPDC057679]|uniref:GmrSD restriction endonuclease domain-containing protein n=1 Tax=Agromyces sp. NPDC057679 TaxID=3346207 RepID=UPI00366F8AE7
MREGNGILVLLGVVGFAAFIMLSGAGADIVDTFETVAGATDEPSDAPAAGDEVPDAGSAAPADQAAPEEPADLGNLLTGTSALAALALLDTDDRPASGFTAAEFGPKWTDTNRNGCSTVDDILVRDLTDVKADGCKVLSGSFTDPFTGQPGTYLRGTKPRTVAVERVVGLESSWSAGTSRWEMPDRARFANDPLNLIAVTPASSKDRAGRTADLWQPADHTYRCGFAARQVAVKAKYQLTVTTAERAALTAALDSCAS